MLWVNNSRNCLAWIMWVHLRWKYSQSNTFVVSACLNIGFQVKLHFTDGALRIIAKKAMSKNTGARGLRTILENILMDSMYEVCSMMLHCFWPLLAFTLPISMELASVSLLQRICCFLTDSRCKIWGEANRCSGCGWGCSRISGPTWLRSQDPLRWWCLGSISLPDQSKDH